MTPGIVDRFLTKMLGWRWPSQFSAWEKETLIRDTNMGEIGIYAPELLRTE